MQRNKRTLQNLIGVQSIHEIGLYLFNVCMCNMNRDSRKNTLLLKLDFQFDYRLQNGRNLSLQKLKF